MKSKYFAQIQQGKIVKWTDCSHFEELNYDEIQLSEIEHKIISAVRGDLDLAEALIRQIKARIEVLES